MAIWTKGHVYLSADKNSYLFHDSGAGTVTLVVEGTTVLTCSATALTPALAMTLAAGGQIGDGATDTVGFWGATPVAQPAATAQSAVATTTINNIGSTTLTAADLTGLNSVVARVTALTTLVNQVRSDLVTIGILKGSN